jgi:hypothetical protein
MSGDDRDERPRLSWREIDQRRDRPRERSSSRPRGAAAEARSRAATKAYVKGLDKLFSKGAAGAEGERLAERIRRAHGTPELAPACREYLEALGAPRDPALLALFLDAGDAPLVVVALETLLALHEEGCLQVSAGLRSQLRVLGQDFDDAVAEAAETLLERL